MEYRNLEYTDIVFVIRDKNGKENNYIFPVKYLKEQSPQLLDVVNSKEWVADYHGESSLYMKKCSGVSEFNDFCDGRFNNPNESDDFYFHNCFDSNGNGELLCESLFNSEQFIVSFLS